MCRCLIAALLLLAGCRRAPEVRAIHLVDIFDTARIDGSPNHTSPTPAALWDFSAVPPGHPDDTLGWKSGDGVTNLKVINGILTGRSTTDFPIIYVSRPKAVDISDGFHSLQVRMRVSDGRNLGATGSKSPPDFPAIIGRGRGFPLPLQGPITKSPDMQNVTVPAQIVTRMNWDVLLVRPTDAAGATFEIESIRAVSQREDRATVRSGVGWQGLSGVYQETLVSRSPERFQLDLDVPANAWLDLNLGSVEERSVTFKLTAVTNGREDVLLERTVTTPHRWEPAPVDLSAHAGRTTLRFSLDVPDERVVGFWGSPVIRVRASNPAAIKTAGLGTIPAPQGVILIMCDTLRRDHLPMYGYTRDTAPHLAQMAAQSAIFLDNISPATWTKVATPSILSGLYPKSHQVHEYTNRLSAAADTIAESYRSAGYATISFSSVMFSGRFTNLQQGFEELHENASLDDPKYTSKTARVYVDRAGDWIERHRDAPFFMFLHVFDPHSPFEPRAPYDTVWADPARKEQHEAEFKRIQQEIADPQMKTRGMPDRSELEKSGVNSAQYMAYNQDWYDGSIRGMDAEVGRLLQRLHQLGLERKVQVAFIGDHGEEFLEHGRTFHGQTVYSELTSVPLMLYRPGVIPSGIRIKETVRSIDLMPTLLELSGLPIPKAVEGQSLIPLLGAVRDGKPAESFGWKPQPAVSEKARTEKAAGPRPHEIESYAIVYDGWKLIHNVHGIAGMPEFELYDHRTDPLDLKDVAAQHPDLVQSLQARLADWDKMVEARKLPKAGAADPLTTKEMNRLRGLGYIQ
jgi:arylsulfatase A-like enzyme